MVGARSDLSISASNLFQKVSQLHGFPLNFVIFSSGSLELILGLSGFDSLA